MKQLQSSNFHDENGLWMKSVHFLWIEIVVFMDEKCLFLWMNNVFFMDENCLFYG
jgi:hypothetical protein